MTVSDLRKAIANVPGHLSVHMFIGPDHENTAVLITRHRNSVVLDDGAGRDYPSDEVFFDEDEQ